MKFLFSIVILLVSSTSLYSQNNQNKSTVKTPSKAKSLIVNGDFSQDETGFTTTYKSIKATGQAMAGVYMITGNPVDMNGHYCALGDHTSGTGKMMVVDASELGEKDIMWKQSVTIESRTLYTFAITAAALYNSDPVDLVVEFNGIPVMRRVLPIGKHLCHWQQYYVDWHSGRETSATITIYSTSRKRINSDLALDDIRLFLQGTEKIDSADIGVEYERPYVQDIQAESQTAPVMEEMEGVAEVVMDEPAAEVIYDLPTAELVPMTPPVQQPAPFVAHPTPRGKNLITNGDFSKTTLDFITSYHTNCTAAPGVFTIVPNPVDMNGWYISILDHTTGTGKMMVVDGSEKGVTAVVWGQTVKVKPGKYYTFSISAAALYAPYNPAVLHVTINNVSVMLQTLPIGNLAGQWQQYQVVWYSDKATTAAISIQSVPGGHMGNDFALDDIWFAKGKKPKK